MRDEELLDLVKGRGVPLPAGRTDGAASVAAESMMGKGGSDWLPIPGDEHGGTQRLNATGGWLRRWPDAEKARGAAKRYRNQAAASALAEEQQAAIGGGDKCMPSSSTRWRFDDLARCAEDFAAVVSKAASEEDPLALVRGRSLFAGGAAVQVGGVRYEPHLHLPTTARTGPTGLRPVATADATRVLGEDVAGTPRRAGADGRLMAPGTGLRRR